MWQRLVFAALFTSSCKPNVDRGAYGVNFSWAARDQVSSDNQGIFAPAGELWNLREAEDREHPPVFDIDRWVLDANLEGIYHQTIVGVPAERDGSMSFTIPFPESCGELEGRIDISIDPDPIDAVIPVGRSVSFAGTFDLYQQPYVCTADACTCGETVERWWALDLSGSPDERELPSVDDNQRVEVAPL